MKKELVIGFFILLVSFTVVSAVTCDDSQTIMRLYSVSNSHVSFWNESATEYVEEICYDEIFGSTYSGANPHDCTGTNRVLSLFDVENSHASITTDVDYNYEVCYGGLQCVYDESAGSGCLNSGKIVARMYSKYNTHVSVASDTNYPVKICCKPGIYWANMNGDKITEADFGDTVKIVMTGVSVISDFEIFEEDDGIWGFLTGGDDPIRTVTGNIVDGNLIAYWTITQEDLDKTNDYDNFKFTVNGETSEELKINLNGNNDPMDVMILSPECGSYFDEGKTINIKIDATDEDDLISGTVKINGNSIGSFTNGETSFNKIFDSPGNFQIVAEAVNTRGKKTRTIVNIMVLDKDGGSYVNGKYVAACITEPKDFSYINESVVKFDASATRGVRVAGGEIDLLVPEEGDVFSWYWRFLPENIVRNFINSSSPLAYRFTAEFPIAGDNSASLRVEID